MPNSYNTKSIISSLLLFVHMSRLIVSHYILYLRGKREILTNVEREFIPHS